MRVFAARRYSLLATALLAVVTAITGATVAERAPRPATPGPAPVVHHRWFQLGRASWYGSQFQGQPTASGETYNMYQMTCAHRTLPIGALVRVTNLRNRRSVVVRVNDRGPVAHNRVIDLSFAAARVLHVQGLAPVRLDLVDANPSTEELAMLTWPGQTRR